jgi:hypothetical protein
VSSNLPANRQPSRSSGAVMQAFRGGDGGGVGSIMGEPKSTEYFRREDGDQGKVEWLKHGSNVVVGEDAETESQVPSPRGSDVVDIVDWEVGIGESVEVLRERRRI